MVAATGSETVEPLCVRLFGTPSISYDGEPVRFVAARSLPLFVYLVLGRERPIARDQLAYKFWPEYSESEARANLRRHLNRVNGPLLDVTGHRWIDGDGKVVSLDPRMPLDLDVARLESACSDPTAAASAVDLYTGDLFEGCDEDWLIPHRERLRSAYLGLLFALIDRYRGERRFSEGIALAQKALRVDPFREDAVRTLMSLHYESGDRSSALNEFEAFRKLLQAELGVHPMHETQSLHDAIRRHAAISTRAADRPSFERAMPFEGREEEIAALRHAWQQAAGGRSRVAVVSGEAGIGKTRLLREFATIAEREGARVLWGASSPFEAAPYEPVTEALSTAISEIARLSLSPALLSTLAVGFPELRAMRPNMSESVELAGERERERFFDAIALATERLCAARPTVMVFDDVHWASADTFELITRIARTCARSALFAIVSYREEQMTSALRSFRHDVSMKGSLRVGLGRLETAACRKILVQYGDVPDSYGSWAIETADGNPLFLSELIRERNVRASGDEREAQRLPASLESTVLARISSLSEATRSLIDIAAVGGATVSIDVLQHASGWPLREVLDAIDELVDRFILRETASGARGDYQFTHELIREAILRSMPRALQARRHRRFAQAILSVFPTREDEFARILAQHFEKAAQPHEAARFYFRAASVAQTQYAWQDAIALAEHALRLEQRPQERFSLYVAIEPAALMCGDAVRQKDAIAMMLALAEELQDDAHRATALIRSSEFGFHTGDFERLRTAAEHLERLADATGNASWQAQAMRCRARGEIAVGRPAVAVQTMRSLQAIDGVRRSTSEEIDEVRILAHAQAAARDFESARATINEAQRRAGPNPPLATHIAIVRAQAMLAIEMAERAEAARLSPILLELCRKIGDVEGEGSAHLVAAQIDGWTFDIASARAHLQSATSIFQRIGKLQSRTVIAINAGALENHVGRLDDAERFYAEALDYANRLGNATYQSMCHANFAYAALLRCDGDRAFTEAQRALELARSVNHLRLIATALTHSACALRRRNADHGESLSLFLEALDMCERFGIVDERRELIAEMIPTLLSCGHVEKAVLFAAELERTISADASAVVMPADALAKAAEAFSAHGDDAAATALRARARSLLHERLESLSDAETRTAYASLPFHQALLARAD
jgi:DNA-binding SARP family transcriptional activator/tetratricopeptide (TPR) repeat protein